MKKVTGIVLLFLIAASCSFEKLYKMQQRRKLNPYEQMEFADLAKIYFSKDKTSVGTIEGIYSISIVVTKKGKGMLSSTEKEKTTERKENYSTVAIIQDTQNPNRDFMEIPLDKNFLPSYSIRGEFTGLTEGNVMVYKQLESRGRESSYTFTYDKSRDILEGIRTESEGNFTYTYKLTYLKLFPKLPPSLKRKYNSSFVYNCLMDIKKVSQFKNPVQDKQWFEYWVSKLEGLNNKKYDRIELSTSLGKTHVWGLNLTKTGAETIVIFPGARTTSLFWDFENGLDALKEFRIFLIETNGLPNLSDGNTPDIKSLGYGEWASEVFDKLGITQAFVAGASFGGLVAMKLSIVSPSKIKAAFLLNPGCLQPFSLTFKNLYFNILPILFPSNKNVKTFLEKAVFCSPTHTLTKPYYDLILEYEVYALKHYKDNTQKPYYMDDELKRVTSDTYLLEGDRDLLFPYQQSIDNARAKITSLKEVITFPNVGHGIETYHPAIHTMRKDFRVSCEVDP